MKPKLRKEAEINLRELFSRDTYPFQSCINCKNFNHGKETCDLANQRPPAKIIVFGCVQYEDNQDIPF